MSAEYTPLDMSTDKTTAILKNIQGLSADSRKIQPGYLFAALPGSRVNGTDFIPQAIQNGATYILAESWPHNNPCPAGITFIQSNNPRRDFSLLAAAYHANQPETIIAVTGTSGKTSVVTFIRQIWQKLGYKAASIGTLGIDTQDGHQYGSLTTPGTEDLYASLAKLEQDGITHMAMEASSHGLDQHRLDGVRIKTAAFTNLSRDHMDYHNSEDDYFQAKARLFSEVLPAKGRAVINADSPYFERLASIAKQREITLIDYGQHAQTLRFQITDRNANGQTIDLTYNNTSYILTLPLIGEFQVYNAICALGCALNALPSQNKTTINTVIQSLETLEPVPGRLQRISNHPAGAQVIVDYAHKPDALEKVLTTLRPFTKGRLICIFGCGGDRDTGKRPEMGAIAAKLTDIVIVTDDNPRSENPATIRADIIKSAPDAIQIGDRRAAIEHGLKILQKDDLLLIAGKGHESGQIFVDHTQDFDDVLVTEGLIRDLNNEE